MNEIISIIQIDRYHFGIPAVIICSLFFPALYYFISIKPIKKKLDPEVLGGFFQVIGTIYALLIGLIVYDATSRYSSAHETVENEAKAVLQVYTLAKHIKTGGAGESIIKKVKEYNDEAVYNDWRILQDGGYNLKARSILRELNDDILSLNTSSTNEEAILPMLIQASMDIWGFRIKRFNSYTSSFPTSEWVLLFSGALITIFTAFFFQLECRKTQSILILLTSLIIFSSLYAIYMFSEPYRGDFTISNEPFLIAKNIMSNVYFERQ